MKTTNTTCQITTTAYLDSVRNAISRIKGTWDEADLFCLKDAIYYAGYGPTSSEESRQNDDLIQSVLSQQTVPTAVKEITCCVLDILAARHPCVPLAGEKTIQAKNWVALI